MARKSVSLNTIIMGAPQPVIIQHVLNTYMFVMLLYRWFEKYSTFVKKQNMTQDIFLFLFKIRS